jgi:two-component system CheB/CheR fusion protein
MADDGSKNPGEDSWTGEGPAGPVVVAIGASAGGLQALQSFFAAIPDNTGAAFVVIVHLDPKHRSELANILSTRTRMPVAQVAAREKLQPDHVYVIAPDRRLQLIDHEISASEFDEPPRRRTPVDAFFRSMAEQLGDGFAVILSGAGSDGALGVRAVKEAGGIILVQDPAEAEYASMPRSAIETGPADCVLPVRELALKLADLMRVKKTVSASLPHDANEEDLDRILALLHVRTGHDFSKYKRSTVLRRIARRMQVARTADMKKYYEFMRANAAEAQSLLSDLLISVTKFFRDAETFDAVAKKVLPEIFKASPPGESIRVWVPGCATGEEAYSLAMLLLEQAARQDMRSPIQIFSSDLDSHALAAAREGRYPSAIEADVGEERLRRFFTLEGDHYRVRQELRDVVLFAVHDLLKDPPFSRIDLISCRNVLIYLDHELQEQVCRTFHYALNPDGFLFLGTAESADSPPGLFRCIDRAAHVYQPSVVPGVKPRSLPRLPNAIGGRGHVPQIGHGFSPAMALSEAALHRRVIEQVAPPSILVDESHRAIHLSENAGRFLMPVGGPMSGDVVDLARPELRFELRSALNRAFERELPTFSQPVLVRFDGTLRRVYLLVRPEVVAGSEPRSAVVMFIEGETVDESAIVPVDQTNHEIVRRLTQEVELAQAQSHMVREESEAANEELRATNEELQSINEEYRSTSEELETSKEELQSINEELQTVNSELKAKLDAISRAHSDLENLVAATDFGTLFLDSSLHIRGFTDRVTDLFSIKKTDEGRPITDFAHRLDYDDLVKDVRGVLANLTPIRREVPGRDDRWYDVRVRPYLTSEDRIDGAVITFVDISERHQAEETLRRNAEQLKRQKHLIDLSRDPIFVWDLDGGIIEWNRGSEELYGYSREEAIGKEKEQLLGTIVPGSTFAALKAQLRQEGSWAGELRRKTKSGRELIVESRLQLDNFDGHRLVLETTRDVTLQRAAERRLRRLLIELTNRVGNTIAVILTISRHTLRHSQSNEDFIERFEGRLSALLIAQTLLAGSDWQGADLAELARQQLAPYTAGKPERLRLQGETTLLPADLASPFGLVLHEFAANAAKHGALSVPTGTVGISWTIDTRNSRHVLRVVWQESGGPPVGEPKVGAFDSSLIDSVIPGVRAVHEFRPEGLVCTIELALPDRAEEEKDRQV